MPSVAVKKKTLPVIARPGALWRFLWDRRAPIAPKLLMVLAVLYVLLPIDAIPDVAPIIGWLDDAGAITLATGWLVAKVSAHETNEAEPA